MELQEHRANGTALSPDRYYELMKIITGSEKQARNAQAELLLMQME